MFKHVKHKLVSGAYPRRGRITEEWCRGAGYGSVMQARFEPCQLRAASARVGAAAAREDVGQTDRSWPTNAVSGLKPSLLCGLGPRYMVLQSSMPSRLSVNSAGIQSRGNEAMADCDASCVIYTFANLR